MQRRRPEAPRNARRRFHPIARALSAANGTDVHRLSLDTAAAIVGRFPSLPVAIVGDVMLDEFIVGRVNRISPEAPVPVVEYDREAFRAGGAANVAHNVS